MAYYEFSTDIDFIGVPMTLAYTSSKEQSDEGELLVGTMTGEEITFLDIINKVLTLFGGSGFGSDFDFEGLGIDDVKVTFDLDEKTVAFESKVDLKELSLDFHFNFWEVKNELGEEGFVFEFVIDERLMLPGDLPVIGNELKDNFWINFDKIIIATVEDKGKGYKEGFQFLGKRKVLGSEEDIDLYLFGPAPNTSNASNTPQSYGTSAGLGDAIPNKLTKWFNIDKTLGPFSLQKIGVQYEDGLVWALVNSSLKMGPLTLSVEGLKIGSPIKFPPAASDIEFGVNGIGLSMNTGGIQIMGAFMKAPNIENYYSGLAIISMSEFTIDAFGGYGELPDGGKAVFVFASVNIPLGGPPFFFVKGFSLGFGFNMAIQLPDIREITSYPLLDTALFESAKSPTEALAKLNKFIYPEAGGLWFAVGIKFTTFELIDSNALLIIDIGKVQIAILGLSILKLPKIGYAFVYVKLGLAIIIKIQEGVFQAFASIAEDSYVIYKDCRVFGDFAFYSWFKGVHGGDFVFSIGGYHSRFKKPSHYPELRRVGFEWRVSSIIRIGGNCFFTLTPSAVMGGFRFEAVIDIEVAKAWFVLVTEFLIQWKPFYFEIRMLISLGIKIGFIKLERTVELEIFGPPVGGRARIEVMGIELEIEFGERIVPKPPLLDWGQFQENYLPNPTQTTGETFANDTQEEICRINISSGLLKKAKKGNEPEKWLVRADEFLMNTESLFPIRTLDLKFFGDLNASQNGTITKSIPPKETANFGIRPMGISNLYYSHHLVEIAHDDDPNYTFNWKAISKTNRVPAGLWATTPVNPNKPEAETIPAVVGMRNIVVLPKIQEIVADVVLTYIHNFDYVPVTKDAILRHRTPNIHSELVTLKADQRSELISTSITTTQQTRVDLIATINEVLELKSDDLLKDGLHQLNIEEDFQSVPRIGYIRNTGTSSLQVIEKFNLEGWINTGKEHAYFKLRKALRQYSKAYLSDYTLIQKDLFEKLKKTELRIHQGSVFLYDVRKAAELNKTLQYEGGKPIQILAFDEHCYLLRAEIASSANIASKLLPRTQELVIQGLPNYDSNSYACGWTSDHLLPLANRIALVGPQFVLQPQAPIRGGEKGWKDLQSVLSKNTYLGEGQQTFRGYTDTQFLSQEVKEVVVLLKQKRRGGTELTERLQVSIPYQAKEDISNLKYTKNFLRAEEVKTIGKFIRVRYKIADNISKSKLFALRAYMEEEYQQYWEIQGVIGLCSNGSLSNTAWQKTDLIEATYEVANSEGIAPILKIS